MIIKIVGTVFTGFAKVLFRIPILLEHTVADDWKVCVCVVWHLFLYLYLVSLSAQFYFSSSISQQQHFFSKPFNIRTLINSIIWAF